MPNPKPGDLYLYGISGPCNSSITLRDLFAAFAPRQEDFPYATVETKPWPRAEDEPERRYRYADAMLKQREAPNAS
jgi:hypothetical protein